jgi:hypothetical protein
MSDILANILKTSYPQVGFANSFWHDKMDVTMPEENESKTLLGLPGQTPENAETSSEVPQASADFRKYPQDTEEFGRVPQAAERKETHTLTVRETARMFEAAGVARTERSIINWCQPNRQGIARLDSCYDPNERKYYITPQSVEAVIQEEIQRAQKSSEEPASESFGSRVARVKYPENIKHRQADDQKIQELEREILDLKITNRGKDIFIKQLKSERSDFFDKLLSANRTVGQLETKLHQLDGPKL